MATRPAERISKLRSYLELLRLPNVFTAIADVLAGFVLATGDFSDWPTLALLVGSSCALYMAGMVLNDVFDVEPDALERPERPLPSGRISVSWAKTLGLELLLLGVGLGWLAGYFSAQIRAGWVATALALSVVLYDKVLKRTLLGPLAMGACRGLNILLGMSVVDGPIPLAYWVVALGVAVYFVGVTCFARTEARLSNRLPLGASTIIMLAGMSLMAYYPMLDRGPPERWFFFWVVLAALVGWRCARAIADPRPRVVQAAVKNSIQTIIVLDAAICFAAGGTQAAIMVLLLIVPTMFFGRWFYST